MTRTAAIAELLWLRWLLLLLCHEIDLLSVENGNLGEEFFQHGGAFLISVLVTAAQGKVHHKLHTPHQGGHLVQVGGDVRLTDVLHQKLETGPRVKVHCESI